MRPGSAVRGSTSIAHSVLSLRAKRVSIAPTSSLISSRETKFGVPPPQCSCSIGGRSPRTAPSNANSLAKYLIYLADLPWSRVTILLQPQ